MRTSGTRATCHRVGEANQEVPISCPYDQGFVEPADLACGCRAYQIRRSGWRVTPSPASFLKCRQTSRCVRRRGAYHLLAVIGIVEPRINQTHSLRRMRRAFALGARASFQPTRRRHRERLCILRARCRNTRVYGGGLAHIVGVPNDPNSGVHEGPYHVRSIVRGTVVHDDQLVAPRKSGPGRCGSRGAAVRRGYAW